MMTFYWCVCAILLSVVVAWTNPVWIANQNSQSGSSPPIQRTACALFASSTLTVDTLDNHISLQSNDNYQKVLYSSDEPCTADFVDEMTFIFLSPDTHPPGTLSWDVLDTTFSILHAWSKTGTLEGARTAHEILKRCILEEEYSNKQHIVDIKHVGMVVKAYSNAGHAQEAECVLTSEITMKLQDDDDEPNRILLHSILSAHARQGNTEEALRIFGKIPHPTLVDYNSLLSAFAKSGKARQAESLLRDMVMAHNDDHDDDIEPDLIAYNCVLDAWSKSKEQGAANRALSILNSLKSPDARSYCSVVHAYLQEDNTSKALELLDQAEMHGFADAHLQNARLVIHGKQGNAKRAQELLDELEKKGIATAVSYNTVLKAWKHCHSRDMVERAQALFQRIVAREMDDAYTYTNLIGCYAKSRNQIYAEKAQELLEHMVEQTRRGRTNVKPVTITVNIVLDALAKSGMACHAENLLNKVERKQYTDNVLNEVRLNTVSYTTVINAFAKSEKVGAAQSAERIFEQMEAAYRNGNVDAKPNLQTMNAVMNAWAQSSERGAPERAEAILTSIEQAYEQDSQSIRPNVVSYTTVVNGWSKSDSPKKLDNMTRIFQRMLKMYESGNEDARPNHISFANMVDAIVKSGEPGAAQRAQDVIFRMYQEYMNGNENVKPQARLVTSVMDCYVKSGDRDAPEKVGALLNWMLDVYEDEDDPRYQPNAVAFNTVINAWAKSRTFGKHQRARSILDKMIQTYESGTSKAKPNAFLFTSVINACAFAIGDKAEKARALQIASATFNELKHSDYAEPNDVTYVAYLTALRNLLPEGDSNRAETIGRVFRSCCEDGQVTDLVLRRVESSLSVEQLQHLYQSLGVEREQPVQIGNLPADWKRNVLEKRPRRNNRR